MTSRNIFFHIMVPVYRAEPYLDECVQSVLAQTYPHFELLLVDDGSPDRSGEMCDAWAERDPRIRVFHKPNSGLIHTRRFTIARVHEAGVTERDYAVFLDSDDFLEPHALQTVADAIKTYRCDCVVYNSAYYYDDTGRGKSLPLLSPHPRVLTDKRELYDLVCKNEQNFDPLWRKAVRMDRLSCDMERYAAFYTISYMEDRLQSLEIYGNCRSLCFIPDILHNYRQNPAGIMAATDEARRCVETVVYEAEKNFLQREPAYAGAPFTAYRSFRIHALTGALVRIARLPLPKEERLRLYGTLKASSYWKEFLDGGGYHRRELGKMALVYEAFRRGRYGLILLAARLYPGG